MPEPALGPPERGEPADAANNGRLPRRRMCGSRALTWELGSVWDAVIGSLAVGLCILGVVLLQGKESLQVALFGLACGWRSTRSASIDASAKDNPEVSPRAVRGSFSSRASTRNPSRSPTGRQALSRTRHDPNSYRDSARRAFRRSQTPSAVSSRSVRPTSRSATDCHSTAGICPGSGRGYGSMSPPTWLRAGEDRRHGY